MCKEKATGEILAMKIRKKDVVVGEDGNIYSLKEKRVLFIFQIKSNPFLIVCCFPNFIPQSPFLSVSHSVQSLKYSFQTSDRLCLVTKYMRGGDLLFHLQRERVFTESRTRFYGAETILGVQHLHQLGIIHRRISVGSFMLYIPQMTYTSTA